MRWGILILLPLLVFPWGDSVREPKLFAMIGLAPLAAYCLMVRNIRIEWPVSALLFAAAATLNGIFLVPSLVPILALWCGLILSLAGACAVVDHPRQTRALFEGVTWFLLAFSVLQKLDWDPIFQHNDPFLLRIPTGFMGQHTLHAAFMACCACVHLANRRPAPFLAAFVTVHLAQSTMAMVGLGAAGCFWIWLHPGWRKRLVGGLTVGAVLLVILIWIKGVPESLHHSGRLEVWRKTAEFAWEKPIFGHGFHSFSEIFPKVYVSRTNHFWQQSHNEILQIFFELGAVGVLFLSLMLAQFWDGLHQLTKRDTPLTEPETPWALVGICLIVNALGSFPWHMPPLAVLGTMAFFIITQRKKPLQPVLQ